MVIVALAGPPFVRFTDSSNNCKVPFVDIIAVNKIVGFSNGTVILKNVLIEMFHQSLPLHRPNIQYFEDPQDKRPYYILSISKLKPKK